MQELAEGSPAGKLARDGFGQQLSGRYRHVLEGVKPLPVFSVQSWLREDLSEVQRAAVLSVAAGYL